VKAKNNQNVDTKAIFLKSLPQKLAQKVNWTKRIQWLAWIELLLKTIVVLAIANAKIFIQNLQQIQQLLKSDRINGLTLKERQRTFVYLNLFISIDLK
jgi:sterol desaturase/sphingolipid hydroxylase (fatty acid hydroxylase superfamily)